MENQLRVIRNILGLVLKLTMLPYLLAYLSESLPMLQSTPQTRIFSIILIIFGVTGMFISDLLLLRFGDGRAHLSLKATRLVNVGFYARTRHPFQWFFSLYFSGVITMYLGFTWNSLLSTLAMTILFLLTLSIVQEGFLLKAFGKRYETYRNDTPAWYWKWSIPDNLKVGFRPQLVWVFGMLVLKPWYKIKVHGTENIPYERPFLIVANHECYLDPFLFGVFVPFEIKFVTTADVFTTPLMRFLMKGTGGFPMRRHRQDLKAIRTMIRMVNSGQVVCIFPEGGRSIDGSPLPILKETLKLIQRCKVPILPLHLDGAYEIWPRWAANRRRGQVSATFNPIIEVKDQSDLSVLEAQISSRIFAPKKIFRPVNSSAITQGLDNLLWACYKCNTRNSIQVRSGRSIQCNHCDTIWDVSSDYTITDRELSKELNSIDWLSDITDTVLEHPLHLHIEFDELHNEIFHLDSGVTRYVSDDGATLVQGLRLILSDKRMLLLQDEHLLHAWPLEGITIFTMDYFNAVSIGVGGIRHSFTLPQHEITLKWQIYFDTLKYECTQALHNSDK